MRLTLWYVALLAAILLAFSAYLYDSLSQSLEQELDTTLATAASQAQASVDSENGRLRLDPESSQRLPEFAFALYDRSGTALVDGTPPWSPTDLGNARARAVAGASALATIGLPGGDTWRVLAEPVKDGGETVAVLEVGHTRGTMETALRRLLFLMTVSVPAVLLFATGGGIFLAGRALAPIERITRLARHIGAEDLSRRLGLSTSGDEVGRLAATFDGMLERLDDAFQRQRRFVADASHELRTPLAVIASQVDVTLERNRTAREYREALQVVGGETERLRLLVSELLSLARADAGEEALKRETVPLDDLAAEITEQLTLLAATRGLEPTVGRSESVSVSGDQTRLLQLLINLVDNALKYTPAGGSVSLGVWRDAGWAVVAVSDTGIGISPEHLPHLFDRFYRVDKARSRAEGGAGLGLAICDWIARAHGGRIDVSSTPGKGSTFTVRLPPADGG